MDHSMHMAPAPAKSGYQQEMDAAMEKMHKAMMIEPTGNPDVDFMRGMIPHHEGAIEMAKILRKYGTDPQTRELATNIIRAQQSEIAMMKKWLAKRGYTDAQ